MTGGLRPDESREDPGSGTDTRRKIPSLNWLRVFEAAARVASFARAAELSSMSTSAISQQVEALETHFGTQLFKREPRQVELTDAGHAFYLAYRNTESLSSAARGFREWLLREVREQVAA